MHYAARCGSKDFISLLLSIGLSERGVVTAARATAAKAGRDKIVNFFDELETGTRGDTKQDIMLINGSKVTPEMLAKYKVLLSESYEETTELQLPRSRSSKEIPVSFNKHVVLNAIDINNELFSRPANAAYWNGCVYILSEDKEWRRAHCNIKEDTISFSDNDHEDIPFDGTFSIGIHSADPQQFSISHFSSSETFSSKSTA